MKRLCLYAAFLSLCCTYVYAQQVDYSVTSVPQEANLELRQMTSEGDDVCMPIVERSRDAVSWFTNRIIGLSPDGKRLAFIAAKDGKTNIFVKDIDGGGASAQRTNRNAVIDFSFSPDGKGICFTEKSGSANSLFTTNSASGYVCRQIATGSEDYTPIYSADMSQIFFTRMERGAAGIWSYNLEKNFLSSITLGMNPWSAGKDLMLVVRTGANDNHEIWRINIASGVEECVLSDASRNFSTPSLSPDGQWILVVGTSRLNASPNSGDTYCNTDLYACRSDGTQLTQLTFHAADDLSPVWSNDGTHIYFISQRGSKHGKANVWSMRFTH